jgi:putative OPT family oligopeptide transporter
MSLAVDPAPPAAPAAPPRAFVPYIAPGTALPELTWRAVLMGTVLGAIFGASSLYLVLKVGLTVSASIPVAVISMTLFKVFRLFGAKDATILENNIAQTAGSAGESIAFGVGVTMPAIMILGFDLELTRVALVSLLGALLGILMMIPLRRALIVAQHGKLKYPEGTACAEVLKAGASEDSKAASSDEARAGAARMGAKGVSARTIFVGFGMGLFYKTAMAAFRLWKDIPEKIFGPPLKAGSVAAEISPELLGVGYIIGPYVASLMVGGGVLAYLVLIPLIKFFGEGIPVALPPGTTPISEMGPGAIRGAYVLYIGAGAVAAAGIISLFRSLPLIARGLRQGLHDARGGARGAAAAGAGAPRTDRDLDARFVFGGLGLLVLAILLSPSLHMNLLGALLIVVFGFLFVTVSSRLTGEIGSTSNPISGMTVATLLLTCIIFLMLGWVGASWYVTALSVGGIVCIAASNGGTTSQDLKTGFLVGATPRYQQVAILVGSLVSALLLGPILLRLNDTAVVYLPAAAVAPEGWRADPAALASARRERIRGPQAGEDAGEYLVVHKLDAEGAPAGRYLVTADGEARWFVDPGINGVHTRRPDGSEVRKFDAPKATLMSYIIRGILDRELPWGLVLFGVMISIMLELVGVPSLAFAVGVYLPISSSTPIFIGGLVRWLVDRSRKREQAHLRLTEDQLAAESDKSPGVLLASGYIAGGAIAGILIAFLAGVLTDFDTAIGRWAAANNPFHTGAAADLLALIPFAVITFILWSVGREKLLAGRKAG